MPAGMGLLVGVRQTTKPTLLDERSSPDFRTTFGELLGGSVSVDVALRRIRLGGVDLEEGEVGRIRRIRLLLCEVNALSLGAEAEAAVANPGAGGNLELVLGLMREGRLSVRAAPLGGWSPDFSVFYGDAPDGDAGDKPEWALLGVHWFQRPYPHRGPAFASLHREGGARMAARRFQHLWDQAHDIGPAVRSILERARRLTPPRSLHKPLYDGKKGPLAPIDLS